jgi:DNA-binding NtrC family response regulator
LNEARRPIYVLDGEQTIVFCNEACLDWLGRSIDEMLGRRCVYHSSPDVTGPDAVAAALCPPPAAFTGELTAGTVARGDAEASARRRARFVHVGEAPDDLVALVVLVDEQDLPETEAIGNGLAATEEPTADELHHRLRRFRREAASRYRIDRLLGESPAMRRVRAQVELATRCRASVLVVGPPGSGRQHVAAAIHYGSDPEHEGSLIPLACSALGADLIQSTVRALAANPLGDRAGRSTLLLNEVDRLPPEVHAELADVLSARSFLPRLVATAEQPLEELVRRGEYRPDLAAVLGTLLVELPPLARRREDLPLLAQMFLEEANSRGGHQVGGFSPEALDRLDAYPWPGNVDELAQMVAQAYERAEGPEIAVGDLPKRIHLAADAAAHPRPIEETIQLDTLLAEIECELIHRALAQAKGNKAKAARLLGLTRPRLYRRLVQLGLEEE